MIDEALLDQAVRRGFRKLYEDEDRMWMELSLSNHLGFIDSSEHKAILIAWDRLISSQSKPSPTPKSAGPQPSFPMNKADHAGGLAIKERV